MKIEVNLPDNSYKNFTEHDIKIVLASALYDKHIVALGYAAESVGLDKRTLMEEMGKYGVTVLQFNEYDVERAIKNGERRAEERKTKE
jgi:predicted HTH domain antitoxin